MKQSILIDRHCAGCMTDYKEIADFDGYDELTGKPVYVPVSDCCSSCCKAHHDSFVEYMMSQHGVSLNK